MPFKFCYGYEIHRCSNPPENFEEVKEFLEKMFKITLPSEFVLSYSSSDNSITTVTNKEEYELLRNIKSSKAIKVEIKSKVNPLKIGVEVKIKELDISDYDSITGIKPGFNVDKEISEIEEQESKDCNEGIISEPDDELKDLFLKFSEKIPRKEEISQLEDKDEKKYSERQVQEIINQTFEDQIPFLIAEVKKAVQEEFSQKFENTDSQKNGKSARPFVFRFPFGYNWHQLSFQVHQNLWKEEQYEMVGKKPLDHKNENVAQENLRNNEKLFYEQSQNKEEETNGNNLLNTFKEMLQNVPTKTLDVFDNWIQKLSGDPYVNCKEGKYPQSVANKAEVISEIFADQDKKEILQFVNQYAREATVEQLADLFAIQKNFN